MSVSVKLDYYGVQMPDSSPPLADLLDRIRDLPNDDERRIVYSGGNPHRLYRIERDGRFYLGELIRIDMETGATKAEIRGALQPVMLQDNQGIGYKTAFLYAPEYQTLVLQVNRRGFTASRFAHFFRTFRGVEDDVELRPLIRQDALDRLNRLKNAHMFEVRIANRGNAEELQDSGHSVRERASGLAEEVESPYVQLRFTSGHQWRSNKLDLDYIRSAVSDLIAPDHEAEVEEIKINGRNHNEETEKIRLIEERLRDEVDVEPNDFRQLSYESRVQNLKNSYRRYEEQVRDIRTN